MNKAANEQPGEGSSAQGPRDKQAGNEVILDNLRLSVAKAKKQIYYRDARTGGYYGDIWQNVNKCVFCDMRDKYIVHEENGIVLTVPLYAYIDGHLFIIPRRHITSVKEFTLSEWETVRKLMYLAKKIIRKTHGIKGVQYIQKDGADAQSTVGHIHFHCVPFDAPNLSTWNYRRLKYTPLENAQLFQRERARILKYSQHFEEKYDQQNRIEVNCNLLIINDQQEVLLHERPSWAKIGNDWISPPGGMVRHFNGTLESELAREVHEETGLQLDPSQFELVSSDVAKLKRYRQAEGGTPGLSYEHRFLWNIYVLRHSVSKNDTALSAGDDAVELVWVPLGEIQRHPRISAGVKQAIAKVVA